MAVENQKKKKGRSTKRKKSGKRAMAVKKEPGAAIIAKLRLADNGIDGFHTSPDNNRTSPLIAFLQLCAVSVNQLLQLRLFLCLCLSHCALCLFGCGVAQWLECGDVNPRPWPWTAGLGLNIQGRFFSINPDDTQLFSMCCGSEFQELLLLFQRVLCASASSAPIERIFSQSGLLVRPIELEWPTRCLNDSCSSCFSNAT